jgi:hypothetical protein
MRPYNPVAARGVDSTQNYGEASGLFIYDGG